jgi:hypothetical protein
MAAFGGEQPPRRDCPNGRVGPAPLSAGPPSEPDVRLSPHPAQATPSGSDTQSPYDPLPVRRAVSSAGPLTTTRAAVSSLSIGWRLIGVVFWWAHLTTSAPFQARAPGPVSGQLCATTSWRDWSCSRGFLSPFGCQRWLLGHPVPARELGSPYGRLTGSLAGPQTGFPCFARTSCDRGECPLYSGDNGAHPDRSRSPASACRITATCPYAPPQHPIDTRLCFTKHQPRVQTISPVRSSPRLWPPDGNGRPWA